jgi:predicted amidohydrolase YtcJ
MAPSIISGKQDRQGSLTPGKWADMVLLADDLFEIPAGDVKDTAVVLTIVGGKVVYQHDGVTSH